MPELNGGGTYPHEKEQIRLGNSDPYGLAGELRHVETNRLTAHGQLSVSRM